MIGSVRGNDGGRFRPGGRSSSPAKTDVFGFDDVQFSAFPSPALPGAWIWGVGTIGRRPINSNSDRLGSRRRGPGPTAVLPHLEHESPWVYGAPINNIRSATDSDRSPPATT